MNVKVSFVCRNSIAHGGEPGSCTAHKLFLRKSRTPVRVRQAAADASDRVPHNLSDLAPIVLSGRGSDFDAIPAEAGVYAVYDNDETLQYIGLSRKIKASVKLHMFELPELCFSVRCEAVKAATTLELQEEWKKWILEYLAENKGKLPPGNVQGNVLWSDRKQRTTKKNLTLTDGFRSAVNDSDILEACREVVRLHKTVVFMKGSRSEPECRFSHRVCSILDDMLVDYETVDTLDEVHNHNLRNVLKQFGNWPTIPQVYHNGDFLGGHDILDELQMSGQLHELFKTDGPEDM